MSNILIDSQEVEIWLVREDGYHKVAGHKVTINNIDFSFVLTGSIGNVEVIVSELTTGARLTTIDVNPINVLICDTKEKTMQLYYEYAKRIEILMNKRGSKELLEAIEKTKKINEEKFGKMPVSKKVNIQK